MVKTAPPAPRPQACPGDGPASLADPAPARHPQGAGERDSILVANRANLVEGAREGGLCAVGAGGFNHPARPGLSTRPDPAPLLHLPLASVPFSRLHPADRATLFILAVVTVTLAVSLAGGRDVGGALALHAGVLVVFAAAAWALARSPRAFARGLAVIAVMFTLYTTLGHVAFAAVPWLADPWLSTADRALLLGDPPALLAEPLAATGWVEFLSVFYASFIPYLYLSIFLGLVGRPADERDEFITGFALLYALSFLGYLFLPARGPVVHLADHFTTPLRGGFFHGVVLRSIEAVGGPHGAFPSLHLGASFWAMSFDFRHGNRLRGLVYVPLVVLIAAATVVLRYHYVVDLIAGAALALIALKAAPALLARWRASHPAAQAGERAG